MIGATFECTQGGRSPEYIDQYYKDYFVDRTAKLEHPKIINTGVLIIPREQSEFLESVYRRWKLHMIHAPRRRSHSGDPFILAADQPHVSHELQATNRFTAFDESFNTLWWHWYRRNLHHSHGWFLFRSKAAALSQPFIPRPVWNALFRAERKTFTRAPLLVISFTSPEANLPFSSEPLPPLLKMNTP